MNKLLDNRIDIGKKYINIFSQFHISYYKLGEKILRIEDNKLQLYNQNFDKEWEHVFDIIPGYMNYNCYNMTYDSQYIYFMQFNIGYTANDVISKLSRFDYSGNCKTIDFYKIQRIRGLYDMQLVDGNLYVIGAGLSKKLTGPEISTQIVALDQDLNLRKEIFHLPLVEENTDYNITWYYYGYQDSLFSFAASYRRDDNGVATSDGKLYVEKLKINTELEQVSRNRHSQSYISAVMFAPVKYDTTKFQIKTNGSYDEIRSTRETSATKLEIIKNGKSSGDLIKEMTALSKGEVKSTKGFLHGIIEVVDDPINETVVVLLNTFYTFKVLYLIQLNKEMKLEAVYEFVPSYFDNQVFSEENFSVAIKKQTRVWQTPKITRKLNGFDFAMQHGKNCQYTFLNYPDYQLVFVDHKSSRKTWGYKVVR